jgi:chemotaxis protein CheD
MIETLSRNEADNLESVLVGLGELKVTHSPSVILSCLGIGSCIAVCIYDRIYKVGGMAHVVLPHCEGKPGDNPGKYADTSIPLLISEVVKQGGFRNRLTVKIAGGAQMSLAPGLKNTFKTGERNLEAVKAAFSREGISITAEDVGGNKGRTVRLYVDSGKVTVRISGGEDREI